MIVPEKHFIHRKLGVRASSDKSQNIAAEKHLNDTDSTIEFYPSYIASLTSFKVISERKSVEYSEAFLSTTGKAPLILVESNVEYLILRRHHLYI